MKSPLNNTGDAVLEKEIFVDEIVKPYNKEFNIDVKKYFPNLEKIGVYKCTDTGYRFYHPFTVAGDSDFYIHFQQFDWYYMPWKWEHQVCSDFIKPEHNILEVGCGQGAFLKKINKEKGTKCIGLELNESCVLSLPGLEIENKLIEDFSKDNAEKFDLVCTFQVLEHIAAVNSFIKGQVDCLKKGGLLVVCVPNNDSVLLKTEQSLLNLPPHHMGLWNEGSLKSLERYFNIKLKSVHFEPLQKQHYDWYTGIKLKKYFGRFIANKIMSIINILGLKKTIHKNLDKKAAEIIGHSIMAVYEKK
jgi:2-polyprenyl-3-methyl-5-hydroxy-6-metoxy-1,4-benzoquinol methylase